jgi:hypothetical protein
MGPKQLIESKVWLIVNAINQLCFCYLSPKMKLSACHRISLNFITRLRYDYRSGIILH